MNERKIVEFLRDQLQGKFKNIWIHKKVSSSQRFRDLVEEKLGSIPMLQPEFDMVFETYDGKLNAVEVKYLNYKGKGYNLPYYHGIGQALALMRFGFDHVGLWLVVGSSIDEKTLNKYGREAWKFIREELQVPLEYSYFRFNHYEDNLKFMVMSKTGIDLLDVDDEKFLITWKNPNPLKLNEQQKILRGLVELYLKK